MCDCNNSPEDTLAKAVATVYNHNECKGISIDLLQMYLNPVNCCLNNSIFETVNCTQEELESTKSFLELYIAAKQADPETCEYKAQLPAYQTIVQRIIMTGICV